MRIFRISRWIALVEDIAILLIISFTFYTTIPIKSTKTIFIPKGSIYNIISQLNQQGYSLSIIDSYILRVIGKPQSGWIDIGKTKLNRIDFLYKITNAKAVIHKITLIPGETKTIFLASVAKQLDLNKTKLNQYYNKFSPFSEAGIYPDTYYVPQGIGERHLILFLTRLSNRRYKSMSKKIYGTYDKNQWLKILTIASIIQKEAANKKEMPIVASVIVNRLKKGMRLQMDGTLNYGKYSHIKVTHQRIKNDTSHFNTYRYKGLPPAPISSVSINAIKAAIKPAKTNYLYFMKNSKGVHDFTDNYKKHISNINRVKKNSIQDNRQ